MTTHRIFKSFLLGAAALIITTSLSAQYYQATTQSVARLYKDKGNASSVMAYIKADTTLDVLVVEEDYLKVIYGESEGWIPTNKATLRNTEGEILRVGEQAEQVVQQQDPASRKEMLIQRYGTEKGNAIYQHKIWKGMTNDMVFDSWGKPLKVERLIKGSEIQEKWSYIESYVVFDDDILVDWGPVR